MAGEAAAPVGQTGWLYRPKFPGHWERRSLYAMAEWVNGLAFRDIQFSQTGEPVIKIAEIKGGISDQTAFTDQVFDASVHLRSGDLLFAWSGQPETSIDVSWWRGPEGWLNQHIFRVTPGREVDRGFFYYLLRYLRPNFVAIARNKQTTGLGHVTRRDLESIEAAFPPLDEQRAIAHILGTLDDKIELNRRMNETLEAIARALFKSWFVDFDPVRGKAEGRDPGLPAHLADLFPDSFEDSELGEIPKGWRVGTLGELCQRPQYGFTASANNEPVGPRFLRITDINKLPWIDWSSVPYCELSEAEQEQYRVSTGDILIARMADPGHGVMIEEDVEAVFASYLIRFRPRDGVYARFIQYWMRSDDYWELVDARRTGTTRASLNAQVLRAFSLIVPPFGAADAFGASVTALRSKVTANVAESRSLASMRDTLLPRLVSGELRIPGAQRIVEASV